MFFPQGRNFPIRVKEHRQKIPQRIKNSSHLNVIGLLRRLLQHGKIRPNQLRIAQAHIGHAVHKQRGSTDFRAGAVQAALALRCRAVVPALKIIMGCQSDRPFFFIRNRPNHGFRRDTCKRLPDGHKHFLLPIHFHFLSRG